MAKEAISVGLQNPETDKELLQQFLKNEGLAEIDSSAAVISTNGRNLVAARLQDSSSFHSSE